MSHLLPLILLAIALDLLGVLTLKRIFASLSFGEGGRIMAWTILIIAGLIEIVWIVALKNSDGFAHTGQGVLSIAISWLSFFMLAYAMKFLPAGTAYAVWTGCGAAGGAIAGILIFGEGRSAIRLASIGLIVVGIVGLRLGDPPAANVG
jgi:quaternary ammonium compound-resistance protein SugE